MKSSNGDGKETDFADALLLEGFVLVGATWDRKENALILAVNALAVNGALHALYSVEKCLVQYARCSVQKCLAHSIQRQKVSS